MRRDSRGVNCAPNLTSGPIIAPAAIVSLWRRDPRRVNCAQILSSKKVCRCLSWLWHGRLLLQSRVNKSSNPQVCTPHLVPHNPRLRPACLPSKREDALPNPIHLTSHTEEGPISWTIGNVGCFSPEASAMSKRNVHYGHHWTASRGRKASSFLH